MSNRSTTVTARTSFAFGAMEALTLLIVTVVAAGGLAVRFGREVYEPAVGGYGIHGRLVDWFATVVPPGSLPLALAPANLLSILGIGFALACFHLANRIHGTRGLATPLLSLLFVSTPAVLAQTLLPTPMGVYLGATGLAYLSASILVTRPSVGTATMLGLATGCCTLLHWSGLFVPFLFLPWVLVRNRELFGEIYPRHLLAFHALLVHGATIFAATLMDPRCNVVLVSIGHGLFGPGSGPAALKALVGQVLIPYFPLLLALVPALRHAEQKRRYLVYALAALPFVLFALADAGRTLGPGAMLLPVACAALLWIREDFAAPILGAGSFVALLFAVNLAMHPPQLDHEALYKTRLRPLVETSLEDLRLPTGLAVEPPSPEAAPVPATPR